MLTATTDTGGTSAMPIVVQCAACLGANPDQPTQALADWASFSGPCVCEQVTA